MFGATRASGTSEDVEAEKRHGRAAIYRPWSDEMSEERDHTTDRGRDGRGVRAPLGTERARSETAASDHSEMDRRDFLLKAAVVTLGTVTLASCDEATREAFFQQHFHEMSADDKAALIARHQAAYKEKYGLNFEISVKGPLDGVQYGYALDLNRCVGCRRCEWECARENNCSRDPEIHWIRVLEMERSHGVDVLEAEQYYAPEKVPVLDQFYMPVACHHCDNPPCVKVCPVTATWKEPDGIVVIDYDWCIGCRYCMAACPYGARHFNWGEPKISTPVACEELPAAEGALQTAAEYPRPHTRDCVNTNTHALGNVPRPLGVVEKCTFCIHRTREGRYPACVEICPVGARKFGNLLDENDEVRYILEHKRVFIFKEELNTQPRFFYYYG